jgi:hypothetical protein
VFKSSSNSPTSNCSPVAIGSYRTMDVGGSASPHAQAAAGPGSTRQGAFSSGYGSGGSSQQQLLGGLHQPLSLPSPSASGLSRSAHAWDHNGGIDTGSSSSSSCQEQQQQARIETGRESSHMQPLEDGISPHVSRSASSSSLAGAAGGGLSAAGGGGGGFGQQGGSILSSAARSPRGLGPGQASVSGSGGSFTRGSSGAGGGGSVEADMQKR